MDAAGTRAAAPVAGYARGEERAGAAVALAPTGATSGAPR